MSSSTVRAEQLGEVRDLVWRIVNEWADREKRRLEEKRDDWCLSGILASVFRELETARFDRFRTVFTNRVTQCCTMSQQEYVLLADWLAQDWEQVKDLALMSLAAARGRLEKAESPEA